jgi:poly-gamma-glutamate capsule biosynthesis protein CapA/YwtB (metallophosphatase superfamily)
MIDAGADLVVGSHPHVVQPVEKYHDRWIAYSLGNFIFDQQGPNTHRGLMLRATVRGHRVVDVQAIPIDINSSFQAALAPAADRSPKALLAERKQAILPP